MLVNRLVTGYFSSSFLVPKYDTRCHFKEAQDSSFCCFFLNINGVSRFEGENISGNRTWTAAGVSLLGFLASDFYWTQRNGCLPFSVFQRVTSEPPKNLTPRVSVNIFRGVNLSWWTDTGYTEVNYWHQMWKIKQQISKPEAESKNPDSLESHSHLYLEGL